MARARKATATTKKHLTKAEIKARDSAEKKLKLDREELVVPTWLEDDLMAYNEFVRIVNEAGKIDLLDNMDLSTLSVYCKAYSSYISLTLLIDKEGFVITTDKGEIKTSPYVTAQNKYVEQIFKCSSKLGLSTTDRLKLIVPGADEAPENKFLKYVK